MTTSFLAPTITIRPAYADDHNALVRLAALDSAPLPTGQLLVAEVEGEIRVAMAVGSGEAIADPFSRTVDLMELLRAHIAAGRRTPQRPRLLALIRAAVTPRPAPRIS